MKPLFLNPPTFEDFDGGDTLYLAHGSLRLNFDRCLKGKRGSVLHDQHAALGVVADTVGGVAHQAAPEFRVVAVPDDDQVVIILAGLGFELELLRRPAGRVDQAVHHPQTGPERVPVPGYAGAAGAGLRSRGAGVGDRQGARGN